ncbi:hypothetical protein EYV94_13925 [Puteibacter caeruleilacunae]|nr:hypothetical protein EYV94_13925 [Puteibacter caeruleilacunae]
MESRINHLIALIDDPDPKVFEAVLEQFKMLGHDAISELSNSSGNVLFEIRKEMILSKLRHDAVFTQIQNWFDAPNDLLEVLFVLAQLENPDIELEKLREHVNYIIRDIWLELNDNLTALEKITIVNHILFQNRGYSIVQWLDKSPNSYMIDQLFIQKKASPLLMTIFYLYITRELGLDVYGVSVPESHFLAYLDKTGIIHKFTDMKQPALFYINPTNEGSVLGRAEIEHLLTEKGFDIDYEYFEPVSEKYYLQRLVAELKFCYESRKEKSKAASLNELYRILKDR